jgi:hypothetical protein
MMRGMDPNESPTFLLDPIAGARLAGSACGDDCR